MQTPLMVKKTSHAKCRPREITNVVRPVSKKVLAMTSNTLCDESDRLAIITRIAAKHRHAMVVMCQDRRRVLAVNSVSPNSLANVAFDQWNEDIALSKEGMYPSDSKSKKSREIDDCVHRHELLMR